VTDGTGGSTKIIGARLEVQSLARKGGGFLSGDFVATAPLTSGPIALFLAIGINQSIAPAPIIRKTVALLSCFAYD
jgi:hypothetical protein